MSSRCPLSSTFWRTRILRPVQTLEQHRNHFWCHVADDTEDDEDDDEDEDEDDDDDFDVGDYEDEAVTVHVRGMSAYSRLLRTCSRNACDTPWECVTKGCCQQ